LTNLLPIFFERLREFARGFVPCCGQFLVQVFGVGVFAEGFQEFAMDVEVANGAGGAAEFAECLAEGLRLAVDGSVGGDGGKELERGLDAAGGGTEFVDGFGRWLLQAVRDCGFEGERLTEKGGDGLRHEISLPAKVAILSILQGFGVC
jgi:hypothetical protein